MCPMIFRYDFVKCFILQYVLTMRFCFFKIMTYTLLGRELISQCWQIHKCYVISGYSMFIVHCNKRDVRAVQILI